MSTIRSYSVSIRSRANREIRRLDRQILVRISAAIDGLVADPRPTGCRKVIASEGLWRIRVGDWRIGYEINDQTREITIVTVGHRSEFYA